jgi:hypothetical protein
LKALHRACDDHDADACSHLPGREISPTELCDAGDYELCERLGDAHAKEVACKGGISEGCAPKDHVRPSAVRDLLPIVANLCRDGSVDACKMQDTLAPHACK